MMPMSRTVSDHCARVRSSSRCTMRRNCNNRIMPSDGCCPICGKVFNVLAVVAMFIRISLLHELTNINIRIWDAYYFVISRNICSNTALSLCTFTTEYVLEFSLLELLNCKLFIYLPKLDKFFYRYIEIKQVE